MKWLYGIGALSALACTAVAIVSLHQVMRFRFDVGLCIWAFGCAILICLAVFTFHLRDRINDLEKRLRERP